MDFKLDLKLQNEVDLSISKDERLVVFTTQQTDSMFILTSHLKGYGSRDIKIEINEDGSSITISGKKPVVSKGDPLPKGHEQPNRITEPLVLGSQIPEKTTLQRVVERPDPGVVAAREEKEGKKQESGPVSKKRNAADPTAVPNKKKKKSQGNKEVISSDHTVDATPLNQAEPQGVVDDEEGQEGGEGPRPEGDGGTVHPEEQTAETENVIQRNPEEQPDEEAQAHTQQPPSDDHSAHTAHPQHHPNSPREPSEEHHSAGQDDNSSGGGGRFVPGWSLTDDLRLDSFRACREMMSHLATPVERAALEELNNSQLVRQAYVNAGSGVVLQAELLRRFTQLITEYRELDHAHQGCSSLSERLATAEQERDEQVGKFDGLLKDFRALENEVENEHLASLIRDKGLADQLEEMEKDRNEWMSVSATQAEKIRKLEQELEEKTKAVERLEGENKQLVTEVAQSEVVHHNVVKELIPVACRRLFASAEYRKSMGRVYNLSYHAGFLEGVKVERKEDDVQRIVQKIKNINLDAPAIWKTEYRKLFEAEYPYIQKLSESYRLPLDDLMNLFPDQPAPKP